MKLQSDEINQIIDTLKFADCGMSLLTRLNADGKADQIQEDSFATYFLLTLEILIRCDPL